MARKRHDHRRRSDTRSRPTLDELFRRAGMRDPQALALADPPDREKFTDGPPRRLTFGEADRAISVFAARLRRLGLQSDTVVAIQLANTVESVIALPGVLRAGMIAAPLPLCRRQDIVAALGRIDAKAFVTAGRIDAETPAVMSTARCGRPVPHPLHRCIRTEPAGRRRDAR